MLKKFLFLTTLYAIPLFALRADNGQPKEYSSGHVKDINGEHYLEKYKDYKKKQLKVYAKDFKLTVSLSDKGERYAVIHFVIVNQSRIKRYDNVSFAIDFFKEDNQSFDTLQLGYGVGISLNPGKERDLIYTVPVSKELDIKGHRFLINDTYEEEQAGVKALYKANETTLSFIILFLIWGCALLCRPKSVSEEEEKKGTTKRVAEKS